MPSLIPRFQAGTAVYEYEKTAILILVRLQPEMQGPRQLWCFASSTNERSINSLCARFRSVIG